MSDDLLNLQMEIKQLKEHNKKLNESLGHIFVELSFLTDHRYQDGFFLGDDNRCMICANYKDEFRNFNTSEMEND